MADSKDRDAAERERAERLRDQQLKDRWSNSAHPTYRTKRANISPEHAAALNSGDWSYVVISLHGGNTWDSLPRSVVVWSKSAPEARRRAMQYMADRYPDIAVKHVSPYPHKYLGDAIKAIEAGRVEPLGNGRDDYPGYDAAADEAQHSGRDHLPLNYERDRRSNQDQRDMDAEVNRELNRAARRRSR